MALRWIEGFDHYGGSQTRFIRVYSSSSGITVSASSPRTGSYCLSHGQGDHWRIVFSQVMGDYSPTEIWLGFAVKRDEPTSSSVLVKVESVTGAVHAYVNVFDYLRMYDSGSSLIYTSAAGSIGVDVWHYIEMYMKVGEIGAGIFTLKLDNVLLHSDTSVGDYKNGTETTIGRIHFDANSIYGQWLDDFYIDDAQFNGPIKVRMFMPDSDGTHSDFVRNTGSNDYECVDETSPDDDTTYIEGDREGDKSTFGYTLSDITNQIIGVQVFPCVTRTMPGDSVRARSIARVGGADYNDSIDPYYIPEVYTHFGRMYALNPSTGTAWNQSSVEASEFGLEITSLSTTTTTT